MRQSIAHAKQVQNIWCVHPVYRKLLKEVSRLFVEIVISVFQQPETTIKNERQWILLEEEINFLSYTHTFGP